MRHLAWFLSFSTLLAQPSASLRDRVAALKVPQLPGKVPTWHTPGFERRAKGLQLLIQGESDFFRRVLGVEAPVELAVLDEAQWKQVERLAPYGMPSVQAGMALMPATQSQADDRETVDPTLVRRIEQAGLPWREAMAQAFDLILLHEYGHALTAEYGISKEANWVSEFTATYFLYAYIREEHPELRSYWEVFNQAHSTLPHPYRSLGDFQRHYSKLVGELPLNYVWYQSRFEARVEQVYARKGVGFLQALKVALPSNQETAKLSLDDVLKRLETIDTGFLDWTRIMEGSR